jgi:tRNA(Ile)-lysidine synthase TilS/MesJ
VEERLIERFAKEAGLGHDTCVCPHSINSNRSRMSRIIRQLEKACPDVKKNIFRSVKRIKKEYLL